MSLGSINLSYSYPNIKGLPIVDVVAKDSHTGEILGKVSAEVSKSAHYNQKLLSSYIDFKKSTDSYELAKPHMYIKDLFVEPSARKRGIGRKLVDCIIGQSILKGYNGRVVLLAGNSKEVSPLPFYRKIGFISGIPGINHQIDKAIQYRTEFNNGIQAFMCATQKAIDRVAKSLRR